LYISLISSKFILIFEQKLVFLALALFFIF